ncbi:sigma-70 family RNA polymerase sigma factor [Rhizobium vallis]|uniref:Sigma-70 family RNA polymerase sigma factor n=1 Tax=Rhizobium vallis TaxID=634290 RepID=A0A3S0SMY5_9HYPH|nr:sigma-70 family RNA polymerase sigma factor [Rhizobium vallis]RUM22278.1 sigma-70 family RNA polymerase sigma factor [Rhizobium vallis]
MTPLARQELIEAARHGDEQALVLLLDVCRPNLRRYARRNCATEDVEEAVQDALFILYRRLGTLRTVATFSGWLFQIVKRTCLRRLQRRKSEVFAEEKDEQSYDSSDLEMRLDLCRSIMMLPAIYRDVVILRDIKGLTAEEAASKLGTSVEATKSRLHRGRYLIRQSLA